MTRGVHIFFFFFFWSGHQCGGFEPMWSIAKLGSCVLVPFSGFSKPCAIREESLCFLSWLSEVDCCCILLQARLWLELSFPGSSDGKASVYNAGDPGSIPGLGRSPGEGNGSSLQYSCLENPTDGGAWQATVHGVAKSQTRLERLTSLHFGWRSGGDGYMFLLLQPQCWAGPLPLSIGVSVVNVPAPFLIPLARVVSKKEERALLLF